MTSRGRLHKAADFPEEYPRLGVTDYNCASPHEQPRIRTTSCHSDTRSLLGRSYTQSGRHASAVPRNFVLRFFVACLLTKFRGTAGSPSSLERIGGPLPGVLLPNMASTTCDAEATRRRPLALELPLQRRPSAVGRENRTVDVGAVVTEQERDRSCELCCGRWGGDVDAHQWAQPFCC